MHTWSLLAAQEVCITNPTPQGPAGYLQCNSVLKACYKRYQGVHTGQTSEPIGPQCSGVWSNSSVWGWGVPGTSTLNNQLQGGSGHNSACSHHIPLCTVAWTMEALLCAHCPFHLCQRTSTNDHSQGPRSAGFSHCHPFFSWHLTKPLEVGREADHL